VSVRPQKKGQETCESLRHEVEPLVTVPLQLFYDQIELVTIPASITADEMKSPRG